MPISHQLPTSRVPPHHGSDSAAPLVSFLCNWLCYRAFCKSARFFIILELKNHIHNSIWSMCWQGKGKDSSGYQKRSFSGSIGVNNQHQERDQQYPSSINFLATSSKIINGESWETLLFFMCYYRWKEALIEATRRPPTSFVRKRRSSSIFSWCSHSIVSTSFQRPRITPSEEPMFSTSYLCRRAAQFCGPSEPSVLDPWTPPLRRWNYPLRKGRKQWAQPICAPPSFTTRRFSPDRDRCYPPPKLRPESSL